jgi:putative two-component system response regulator
MPKLLVVESSAIVRGVFKKLLDEETDFNYDLAETYAQAEEFLAKNSYEYAVVERKLSDSPDGEIIALLNKHDIAPLVFTKEIDEVFFESFESAKIVDYIVKQKYNNISNVITKLKQLQKNRDITILVVADSYTYKDYLEKNLELNSFKVLAASNVEETLQKIEDHPEISLMILDDKVAQDSSLELVKNIRIYKNFDEFKILILANKSNSYATSKLLNRGANDYIVKPFSRNEFYIRVYQNIKTIGEK